MSKEFEDYWEIHQKHLILNAPKEFRDELLESNKLDTPVDWLCFVLPIGVGIGVQPMLHLDSEILSWGVILLIVVVLFVLLQMIKPLVSSKKSSAQVVESIKQYYYERYKKFGLNSLEPWKT